MYDGAPDPPWNTPQEQHRRGDLGRRVPPETGTMSSSAEHDKHRRGLRGTLRAPSREQNAPGTVLGTKGQLEVTVYGIRQEAAPARSESTAQVAIQEGDTMTIRDPVLFSALLGAD